MSESQANTLTAPAGAPARLDLFEPREQAVPDPRGGNGKLRLLGLLTVGLLGALVAWDLRRREVPTLTVDGLVPLAPYALLVVPLLAGLGMLAGRRPAVWGGLLVGGGAWAVLAAVWSALRLMATGRELLPDGAAGFRSFAASLEWVPYAALLLLGLAVLVTAVVLRGHGERRPCEARGHRLTMLGATLVALAGPLWLLALVPAIGLGLRSPHRTATVAWLGWVAQGVVALGVAALGLIPASGPPELLLRPSAPMVVLLGVPLLGVAALAGALATADGDACQAESLVGDLAEGRAEERTATAPLAPGQARA